MNNRKNDAFVCVDSRNCFAKGAITGQCMILMGKKNQMTGEVMPAYENGKCVFCKPVQNVTNGVEYPTPADLKIPGGRRRGA